MDMSDKLVAEAADELERDREQLRAESRAPVAASTTIERSILSFSKRKFLRNPIEA